MATQQLGRPAAVWAQWAPVGLATLGVGFGLAGALWAATHLQADQALSRAALFVHLASLVAGFGAVLAVDWVGVLWLLGRRRLGDVLEAAADAHIPIWAGYSGLVASGVLLAPDLSDPLTRLKLALVLVIGWNGVLATALHRRLTRRRPERLGGPALAGAATSAVVSQLGWWGATMLGFLNGQ